MSKGKQRRGKPQILLVDWNDAASPESSEWKEIKEDTLDGVARVRSIGYLGHRDKRQIVLIQTVSEDGGFFGELAIPMGCVTRIRRLK